ncbi:MAG: DNA polymerase III subunit beta [Candidatus Kerfeldbacteria bacterium]|nr:DNA polymerase III subunit beta [Candidatus Kerfeldbacteria bacterium]
MSATHTGLKVTCTRENLLEGLTRVTHIAGKNASLPILSNVLLRAHEGRLTLVTTNLEAGIRTYIRGKVEREGELTVPAALLTEYVTLLPNDVVTLEATESTLDVTTKERTSKVKGMPADEFPVLPDIEQPDHVAVDSALLRQAISQVAFAVATDDARPEISGVYLQLRGKAMTLVATDSYRLCERSLPLAQAAGRDLSVILPVRTLHELSRILDASAGTQIALSENQVRFTIGETELISRLIEGQYPDYQQIIPTESATTVTCDVDALVQAVRSTSLFCKSGINDVVLTVETDKQRIVIQATNAQVGESTSVVGTDRIDGTALKIVFNYRYLLEGLQSLDAPQATIRLVDQSSPGVIRPAEETGYLYLLMPIKQ